jgi:methylmalonyl-CoA/ethylmalonyl-CoA epimerase
VGSEFISHVGIAVRDLEKSIALYELALGRKVELVTEVPDQQARVAIFGAAKEEAGNSARIELVASTSENSPISRFIDRHGEGLHHLCINVENIDEKLAELKRAGFKLIDETPRVGAEGEKIAFVHPSSKNGVLLELHQRAN